MDRRSTLAALAFIAFAAQAQPIIVADDRGATVTLSAPARRIVSLLPSITESVCAVGACDRLVGTDRSSDWPERIRSLPKLGGIDDTQVERIVALAPDVVLAPKSSRVADRLEGLGLKVVLVESQTHADVRRSLATVAHIVGMPDEGVRAWDAIDREIVAAAARVPMAMRGKRVYFEVGSAPYAAGAASFIGETLSRLGMGNVVPPAMGPFPRLNPEFVVRSDPDVVIASQRDLAGMRERPGWERLAALTHGRTCGIEARRYDVLVRPGPRLGDAAAMLADCLASLPTTKP